MNFGHSTRRSATAISVSSERVQKAVDGAVGDKVGGATIRLQY